MLQRTYKMDNPIWTCEEIEDVMSGVKLQKQTPDSAFKSLSVIYVLVDGEKSFNILEDVYETLLKIFK